MESIARISCSYFEKLSSSNQGTILNSGQGSVIIEHSSFQEISSSSFPGCFYTNNAKLNLNNCLFSFCQAGGTNQQYGRVLYACDCNNNVHHISSFCCALKASNAGDSVIFFNKGDIKVNSYNYSYCYGTDGSSSFGSRESNKDVYISFLIVCHSQDHNSFEILFWNSGHTYISDSNIINTSSNSHSVININNDNIATFTFCYFGQNHRNFNNFPNHVILTDCSADKTLGGYELEITNSPENNFNVQVNLKCLQNYCKLSSLLSLPFKIFTNIFMLINC